VVLSPAASTLFDVGLSPFEMDCSPPPMRSGAQDGERAQEPVEAQDRSQRRWVLDAPSAAWTAGNLTTKWIGSHELVRELSVEFGVDGCTDPALRFGRLSGPSPILQAVLEPQVQSVLAHAEGSTCADPGEGQNDVGMTGLSMLAFLGDGNTTREGPYKEQVAKAIKWMKDQQDGDLGLYGEKVGHSFMYNHSIATLAMCEAYYFSRSPLLRRSAQDAINFLSRARNPYGAWRYASPPAGDNDTSVTGWCVFAMASAQEGGLTIDPDGFVGAAQWIDDVTDPATGRTGYDTIGSASSRVGGLNDQYPTDKGEAMTAVAIVARVCMDQDMAKNPLVDKGAELLKQHPPEWDSNGLGNDMYYWYYGSYAMFQLGGPRWDAWNEAAKKALLDNQRHDGDMKGSWDPKDAWGHSGGRVYTTALGALCLEVYFRYARVRGR